MHGVRTAFFSVSFPFSIWEFGCSANTGNKFIALSKHTYAYTLTGKHTHTPTKLEINEVIIPVFEACIIPLNMAYEFSVFKIIGSRAPLYVIMEKNRV